MKKVLIFLALFISLVSFQESKAQTIWTVTNLGNSLTAGTPADNNIAARTGSLRFCLANCSAAGPNEIQFSVAGDITQSGYQNEEITGKSNLTINGFSAPGAICGSPTVRFIVDGTGGWLIDGSSSAIIIKGLSITGWFRIEGSATGCQILGCNINTANDGLSAIASATNYAAAIRITGASTSNNIIGGLNDCDRNIINGGLGPGTISRAVFLLNAGSGNKILGNYCGVDKQGTNAIGNYFATGGVIVNDGAISTTIQGNVLSNGVFGIYMNGTATNAIISDNMIGADKNGLFKTSFAMNQSEIYLKSASGHVGTLISGNVLGNQTSNGQFNGCGIAIEGSSNTGIQILNNYIGVDKGFNSPTATGVDASGWPIPGGPAWAGIWSRSGSITISGNYIGNSGFRNAQRSHGIATEGASNWTITNNYIGVTPSGADVGNGHEGIEVNGSTTVTVSGNVIGFNKGLRVAMGTASGSGGVGCVGSGVTGVTIDNNYIGVTPAGLAAGNVNQGVWMEDGSGTQANFTISNNKIAYNEINGIGVTGGTGVDDIYITNNCMWCNGTGAYAASGRGINIPTGNNNSYGGRATAQYTIAAGTFPEVKINAIGVGATNTDTSGAVNWTIRGYSPANATIEIFVIDQCHTTASGTTNTWLNEGEFLVATIPAASNTTGFWSVSIPKANMGRGLVATATGTGSVAGRLRTSEFSNPIIFNPACLVPRTVTLATSPTPASNLCVGTALGFTGAYTVLASCAPESYYGSWYKDGTLFSGPTLLSSLSSAYSISSLVLTDAGTYTFKVANGTSGLAGCAKSASAVVTVVDCTPQPVEWISFNGVNSGSANKLFLKTGVESQNDHFEVERSLTGVDFELIGVIASSGSSQGATYTFEDDHIKNGQTYYYRIKQVDKDLKYSYSSVITISTNGGVHVNLYPNPASNSATISLVSVISTHYTYRITDLLGKTHAVGYIDSEAGISETLLDFTNLSEGLYVLIISDEAENSSVIKVKIQK